MSVADQGKLQMYCYRINKSTNPIKMSCLASQMYFDISLNSGGFDS